MKKEPSLEELIEPVKHMKWEDFYKEDHYFLGLNYRIVVGWHLGRMVVGLMAGKHALILRPGVTLNPEGTAHHYKYRPIFENPFTCHHFNHNFLKENKLRGALFPKGGER